MDVAVYVYPLEDYVVRFKNIYTVLLFSENADVLQ